MPASWTRIIPTRDPAGEPDRRGKFLFWPAFRRSWRLWCGRLGLGSSLDRRRLDGLLALCGRREARGWGSWGLQNFTISLVTDYHPDYPEGKSSVYLKGLDLLSDEKRKKVSRSINRKEPRLRRQLQEPGGWSPEPGSTQTKRHAT